MGRVLQVGYGDIFGPNATAFGRNNPLGSKRNAIFSSDIGHFEIDMRHPLPEAYELVEDGQITADDFRAFTFENNTKRHAWGQLDIEIGKTIGKA